MDYKHLRIAAESGGIVLVTMARPINSYTGSSRTSSRLPTNGLITSTQSSSRERGRTFVPAMRGIAGARLPKVGSRRGRPTQRDSVLWDAQPGKPEDLASVAALVTFIAAEGASFVTGTALTVDGGSGGNRDHQRQRPKRRGQCEEDRDDPIFLRVTIMRND